MQVSIARTVGRPSLHDDVSGAEHWEQKSTEPEGVGGRQTVQDGA
jgi:hypothetical protein